jgi:class 3 adenylate cyclase/tetratricopeptide (TPR) repeat protein
MSICSACGEENSDRARFCQGCGAPLEADAEDRGSRKTVTVLFCDLEDSTGLGERLDPESLRLLLARYFEAMRGAIEQHGGTVEKFIGDAIVAVFGIPRVHEDDAIRAVRAAEGMRGHLQDLNEHLRAEGDVTLQIRIGINTGQVLARDTTARDLIVTGDAVNVAARFEQIASPGQIVMGDETYRLLREAVVVEPLGPVEAKGKSEPLLAYALDHVVEGTLGRPRRLDAPMVGRRRALAVLEQAYEGAVEDASCQLLTVLGPAGVGKSRLVEEFISTLDGAAVYRGWCLPYGEGLTFFPIVEVVKQAVSSSSSAAAGSFRDGLSALLEGVEHRDTIIDRIIQLTDVADVSSSDQTFWACRRLLEALADRRPVVVILDDIQWGAPTFLDLIEHVADLSRDVRLLLLTMARPELLEARPSWSGGKFNATTISLEPLSAEDSGQLVDSLLGSPADPEVRSRIVEASGGTPLFVEEILAKLIDDGLLVRTGSGWDAVGDLSDVPMPATIAALLAARIDQLPAPERAVLERAAVAGDPFALGAVRALADDGPGDGIDDVMSSLVRKDLVRPDRSSVPAEDGYRFRHLLIRDAAYDTMPKQIRADLHERYASWLERPGAEGAAERQELVGFHLERAFGYRVELGLPADPRLGRRAAGLLAGAARRASLRFDFATSSKLLERAVVLLPDDDPERVRLRGELAAVLSRLGETRAAETMCDAVIQAAARSGDIVTELRARIDRMWARREFGPPRWLDEMRAEVEPLIPILEARGDDLGLTKGLQLLASGCEYEGRHGDAEALLRRALDAARAANDPLEVAEVLGEFLFTLPHGPTPVEEALGSAQELASQADKDLRFQGWALGVRAQLEAMRSHFALARELAAREDDVLGELGMHWSFFLGAYNNWMIEMLAGRPDAAEEAARRRLDQQDLSDVMTKWGTDALLATALCEQGKYDEAQTLAIRWEGRDGDDQDGRIRWSGVRARISAELGRLDEAVRHARTGVSVAGDTDRLNIRAAASTELARALRRSGDVVGANVAFDQALGLYDRKGNIAAAARLRDWWG